VLVRPQELIFVNDNCVISGGASTVRVVEVLALVYVEVATCDAVIVVDPAPVRVMRRVLESIVATAALELV
jgi:hypothetical protein